jgi:hypothetical protein
MPHLTATETKHKILALRVVIYLGGDGKMKACQLHDSMLVLYWNLPSVSLRIGSSHSFCVPHILLHNLRIAVLM